MKFADALKEMIHRAKLTQKGLATPIARGDIKLSTLCRLANSAGYDVMLVRRDAIEPEYPIKIEYGETEK